MKVNNMATSKKRQSLHAHRALVSTFGRETTDKPRGGLKNTVECRLFRQKLLQSPLALRCGTEYVQPHEMHRIVNRYLDGPWDSPSHQLKQLLEETDDPSNSEHITAVTQLWCEIFNNEETWLTTSVCVCVCVTCFAILWLALKGEGVSSMVATTLDAAAGLTQRQKWGLILPSSARVSLLTYQGVRYPELVKATADGWRYGRYVSTEATLQGGFLPVFCDVPKSTMHAVSDIGALVEWLQANIEFGHDSTNNLAVLHNQNRMVDEFGLSAWVAQSKRQVISRSVTSCAGMTAFMVVVAQTKVGFLTGGRGQRFRGLPEEERHTQEEEAYARATVALTRARKMCVIFCPLDMKGLIGAATVMGSLMYGAGHCWHGMINMHLRGSSLEDCPGDDQFLSSLDLNDVPGGTMAQRRYPPVALIECVADITQKHHKVRRLHLVIVDLWRPWKINQAQVRSLTGALRRLQYSADCTTPLSPKPGKTPLHGRRFVYGYSLDGSDFPCYLLWPMRTLTGSSCLLESQTQPYVDIEHAGFLHPLGLRHFYDGFSLRAEVSIRSSALEAFQLQEEEVSPDLVLSRAAVAARGWGGHQEQPVDQNAPKADRRNVPDDVISVSDSEVDQDSSLGEESSYASGSSASDGEDSSDSEPAMSEVSDQYSMLEHAYQSVRDVFSTTSEGKLVGGDGSLNQLESLPAHWPLAKLTVPLKFGVNRLDGLVVGYLMELMATHSDASKCRKQISSFAKTLTVRVATYLAKEIASLFRPVLYHPLMSLTEDDTLPLLTSEFWVLPVYEELLHAASRFNLSPTAELKRPTSNLVKIASHVKSKPGDAMIQGDQHTTMTDWLGADCPVDFLNVWFPAHWSPIVLRELHEREVKYRGKHRLWFDDPAMASDTARLTAQRRDAVKSRELHFHLGAMDEEKNLPTLIGKLKIDWLDFPVDDILQQFTTLKEGILRGVFKQKAARAWFGCRAEKAQVTVLLPGSCSLSEWSEKVDCMPHSWPKSFNIGRMQMGPVQANTFHLHRKFTRARHMWLSLKPDWRLLAIHMYTDWPGIHSYEEINDRLFANPGMTISRILRPRRDGIRRPIGNGLASVTICGNSLMHKFPLSGLLWKRLLRSIVLTSRLNKLRLQNIHRPLVGRRNGRRKMGSIN